MNILIPCPRQNIIEQGNEEESEIYYQCHFCDHREVSLELAEEHQRKCFRWHQQYNKRNEEVVQVLVNSYIRSRAPKRRSNLQGKKKSLSKYGFLKRFDMLSYLKLKKFPITSFRTLGGRSIKYKCRFCKRTTRSRRELSYHQDNSHFFQIQKLRLYIAQTRPLCQIVQVNQDENQLVLKPNDYHSLIFYPYFSSPQVFHFYKCNFCSFVDHSQRVIKSHTQKSCQKRIITQMPSQHPIYSEQIEDKSKIKMEEEKPYLINNDLQYIQEDEQAVHQEKSNPNEALDIPLENLEEQNVQPKIQPQVSGSYSQQAMQTQTVHFESGKSSGCQLI